MPGRPSVGDTNFKHLVKMLTARVFLRVGSNLWVIL